MDSNRFFRFLGRVNTVLITLAGIGALIVLAASAAWLDPFDNGPRARYFAEAGNAAPDTLGGVTDDSAADSAFTVPQGWSEAAMLLQHRKPDGELEFSSGRVRRDIGVNVLLIDLKTAGTRWLFRGTARDILSTSFVHGPKADSQGEAPVTGLVLVVADADTNRDGRIDAGDAAVLYAYKPGAAGAARILAARAIESVRQVDAARVAVVYNDDKGERVALFSADDYRLLASVPLPIDSH